ncbi:MAG: 50S ribosomal protein L31 [Myxococcota bacterium]|nr:50S ribosomal protein L31 [Myxococcota bacterium]
MKPEIHPLYPPSRVTCVCGNKIESRSTRGSFQVEICSNCHPFYTGKYKLVDTAGRIDRFKKKYAGQDASVGGIAVGAQGANPKVAAAAAEAPAGEKAPKAEKPAKAPKA